MSGTKTISDLITDPNALQKGRINIIDAPVSAGKTHFALTVLPKWSSPERILYLIDTTNGEMRLQSNMLKRAAEDPNAAAPVDRLMYSFCDYNMSIRYDEYMKSKTIESQIQNMYGENPIHNQHIDEFREMARTMIDQALKNYSEQIQLDVQTKLNGNPVTMSGLVSEIKKQIYDKLRKAFK